MGQPRTCNSPQGQNSCHNPADWIFIQETRTISAVKSFLMFAERHSSSLRHANAQRRLISKPFLLAARPPPEQVVVQRELSKEGNPEYFRFLPSSSPVLWYWGWPLPWPAGAAGSTDFHCAPALKWQNDLADGRGSPGCSTRIVSADVKITANAAKVWPPRAVNNLRSVVQSIWRGSYQAKLLSAGS